METDEHCSCLYVISEDNIELLELLETTTHKFPQVYQ